jgi:hypothetical protein
MKESYFAGLVTGVLGGITLLKFLETVFDWKEDDKVEVNSLQNALLSHALQTVYPNRTSKQYFVYNGKYLPPMLEALFKGPDCPYYYMKDIRHHGVQKFIERYLYSEEKQRDFFNSYWEVVNEGRHLKTFAERGL